MSATRYADVFQAPGVKMMAWPLRWPPLLVWNGDDQLRDEVELMLGFPPEGKAEVR